MLQFFLNYQHTLLITMLWVVVIFYKTPGEKRRAAAPKSKVRWIHSDWINDRHQHSEN